MAVLLDTCAIIWIAENQTIDASARRQIILASASGGIYVSPISAWEIGLLAAKRGFVFLPDPATWFADFIA